MDINYYKSKYEPIAGEWYIKEQLGKGSYGSVFRIEKEDMSGIYSAALKIISIPQSKEEVYNVKHMFSDDKSVSEYFKNLTQRLVSEFKLMSELKGNSNIVSYEGHSIHPHEDSVGYDVLIRMELLTPLTSAINSMNEQEVINLGIDICKALETCQKHNIVHRDIKLENIFISNHGDYKLGDFGVAKTMGNQLTFMTTAGTFSYMAPELKKGEACTANVDIYSLGMVMYKLLNFNRDPFLPLPPAVFTFEQREQAMADRLTGKPLPKPANASDELSEIILKACEYNPLQRYQEPAQLKTDLENLLHSGNYNMNKKGIAPIGDSGESYEATELLTRRITDISSDINSKTFKKNTQTDKTASEIDDKKTALEYNNKGNYKPEDDVKKGKETKSSNDTIMIWSLILLVLIIVIGAVIASDKSGDYNETIIYDEEITSVACGDEHTLGLKEDGTVIGIGSNDNGQLDVEYWEDIAAIDATAAYSIGLRSDGRVVFTGNVYGDEPVNIEDWENITDISAGQWHIVGLKDDGTVVATGSNETGQCDVYGFEDIVSVKAGVMHTVALKSDGTVIAVGENADGQLNVDDWTDIVAIEAGGYHTIGLRSDGTVVSTGDNYFGQCDVSDWEGISAIIAGDENTIGLKEDGTVVAVGYNEFAQSDVAGWTDINSVAAGHFHTVAICTDGTVVSTGDNTYTQCDVEGW